MVICAVSRQSRAKTRVAVRKDSMEALRTDDQKVSSIYHEWQDPVLLDVLWMLIQL